jgi:CRP-like cAMP-binding protein
VLVEVFQEQEQKGERSLLQNAAILYGWSTHKIEVLLHRAKHFEFARGDYIYREGEYPKYVYFLKRGSVEVA